MILTINLKQIGQRKQKIVPVEFDCTPVPQTLRELITETVHLGSGVFDFGTDWVTG